MISDNLKLALARIVELMPHLKADGAAIPTAHRPVIEAIRADAAKTAQSTRDPQIEAAERWALGEIEKALGADYATVPAPITPDAPQDTGGKPEQGIPSTALEDKPLGELTDAELESLTAPEKEGA